LIWLASIACFAQQDSLVLTYDSFIRQVILEHPLAKRAALQNEQAAAIRLKAKGGFDPKLAAGWNNKYFVEKDYYRIFEGKVSVPTKYGFEVVGSYQNTDGVFLNPQNKTDKHGLWALGIEANLIQGLLIDERRLANKQAELFEQQAQNEQQLQLNELLMNASQSYIYWQTAVRTQRIIEASQVVAQTYFEATKQSFINGAKPAIDTLEAYLVVQDRLLLGQKNRQTLVVGRQLVEQYLWTNDEPLFLNEVLVPAPFDSTWQTNLSFSFLTDSLLEQHPVLLDKRLMIQSYELSQRLKREKMKPKLKVKYNPLIQTAQDNWAPAVFSLDNYKFGVDFSMPLFLRKERADVRLGEIKIQEASFELLDKRNSLLNKLQALNQKRQILGQQLILQRENRINYLRLLEAEQTRFTFGESSVFLLNKRQEKYIEVQIKEIELEAKNQLNVLEYLFVAGKMQEVLIP